MGDVAHRIRRGFCDVGERSVHYRTVGEGRPLLAIHASPGSARQLQSLMMSLADDRMVIAPDTPGNGDSDPLAGNDPDIVTLAAATLQFLDAMSIDRVDLYGSHTGAAIAAELAILAPDRIGGVVLDGIHAPDETERKTFLARYAFPFEPDLDGAYMLRAFQFCRDQYIFFPWYDRTIAAQRRGGLPRPQDLHNWVVEVLKSAQTYHLSYRAAFRWRALDRLPLMPQPALVLAGENDPLFDHTETAAGVIADGRFIGLGRLDSPEFPTQRAEAILSFLASMEHVDAA